MNIGKYHARGSKKYGPRTHPHGYKPTGDQQQPSDGESQQPQQPHHQSQSQQQVQQQSQQQSQHQQQQQSQHQQQQPPQHHQNNTGSIGNQQHQQQPPKYKQNFNINNNNNNNNIGNSNNNNNNINNNNINNNNLNGNGSNRPPHYHNNISNNNNNNNSNNININNNNNNNNNGGGYNNNQSRRGGRGGNRGGSKRGGNRGGNRGGRFRSSYYNSYKSPRSLKTVVTIPQFSGGVIIGVRGSLWGLLNKATTARLKVFKTTAVIRCSDAQQLDRAKEIVLKLKNTAPKYLSLIDYKGDQRLKFIQQPPNCSVVILENNVNNVKLTQEHDKELVKNHEAQFVNRYSETLSLLHNDRNNQTPFVDIKTGSIWFLYNSNIPSTPMLPEKYELHTESLDSIFQVNTIINEQFIHKYSKLYKEKKTYTLITILDTQTLDLITLKCKEEKIGNSEEYRFSSPQIYKITHHINSKILFPQSSKLGPYDLRISIDSYSKSPCTNNNNNNNHSIPENYTIDNSLLQYLLNINIIKTVNTSNNNNINNNNINNNNSSNSNNNNINSNGHSTTNFYYQNIESNLFLLESIINQKVSIYRDDQIQFNLIQDLSTRFTTSSPEFNKQTNTILCTSPNLYDMFKSKNWSVDRALDEIKQLTKNVRVLISNHFDSSKSPLVPPNPLDIIQSNHDHLDDESDESDEEDEQN